MSSPRTIIIPAAERIKTGERGLVSFKVGEAFEQYLVHLFRYQEIERRSPAPYYWLAIDVPHRPRTTGHGSQNHHINGHCQQISVETGQPFGDVKRLAKQFAVTMGYPILEDESGEPILDLWGDIQGISETQCSTEDASILIEAIHQIAAEMEIELIED
ncbi:hypothetical protein [Sediminispirochaeta smaragdinae]|uniref:Uncharacterized protein n=1 Tax=Sediminispirochaeta smaragdinae (strain DSM 11293 / JCM 15392 / SEBR 4228) TaxID=573413 RepID=E1R3J8_SEDSS|nr:hypothetical protein [Sediminispirochaeta smaragdinae]ADK81629.1 hypothetical protein Spirs_2516 [Sediminispirochaeta smaragdinae DSM 11293]